MSLPSLSAKERTLNRAKALVKLSLPCLALAAVVSLFFAFPQARPAFVTSKATVQTQTGADGWLSANAASSSDATVEVTQGPLSGRIAGKNGTATTVTTYTVFGTY